MRLTIILAFGALAACTTGDISVPQDPILYQASPPPMSTSTASASSSGGNDAFMASVENALGGEGVADPGRAPTNAAGTPLNDDTLNLTLYTIEQQKVDARLAEEQLAAARDQLVIIPPTSVPNQVQGVNIALYAQQTSNAVGERVYQRRGMRTGGGCGRYSNPDDAQRAFLAAGGPQDDPRGMDPDGDGFACSWDPTPYRQLRL